VDNPPMMPNRDQRFDGGRVKTTAASQSTPIEYCGVLVDEYLL
jgi:hypothetical protein